MDFYTVLDQVLALLRQRGRVSYRALKRQFHLDDEALADLTAELLYAHHPVVEEEGSGLVWLGNVSTAPEGPAPVLQPATPRAVQDTPGTRSPFPPTTPPPPEAERRQLTVLFCDLVDSTALAGQLDPEDLREVVAKTDGVPLFVEELTKTVLESALLREHEDHDELTGPLPALAIPATLQDSLMARLDRLSTVKTVAQLGATIGRQFTYDLLQAISPLDEGMLQQGLRQLVEAELLYQRGMPPQATYIFKHALIQATAYQSLLKSTRQRHHQCIAQVVEERFPDLAETQPELLAYHYTEAGLIEQAVGYWHKAGQKASERSAHIEAISHLTKGLALLEALPEPARTQHELRLLILLGAAFVFTKGHNSSESQQAYTRARQLCQQTGETSQLLDVLYGLRRFYFNHGELHIAREFAEQALQLASDGHDVAGLLISHYSLALTLFSLGELPDAHRHFERGLVLREHLQACSPAQLIKRVGVDSGIVCRITSANTLWLRGYPAQALKRVEEALHASQTLSHPSTHVLVLWWGGFVYQCCHEALIAQEWAQEMVRLSREQKYEMFEVTGNFQQSCLLAMQGHTTYSIEQMHHGFTAVQAMGGKSNFSSLLALLANAYRTVGQTAPGLAVLDEALVHVEHTGERHYEAEIHRLKGELLLQLSSDNHAEAETCFHQALGVARRQQAKSWELRAAMSLGRLWQRQGKRDAARQVLAEVYGWFTEGFDTADLQEAKALLEALG